MAKAIYCLKIWLFRDQFSLSAMEKKGIYSMCLFTIRIYCMFWYTAPSASAAASNDLRLMKTLIKYSDRCEGDRENIYNKAARKFSNHLWYLSEQNVAMALFDENVSTNDKKEMIASMRNKNGSIDREVRLKKKSIEEFRSLELKDCFTQSTTTFFEITGISSKFLLEDPEKWEHLQEYRQSKSQIEKLQVINDCAERGVALIQSYCGRITKNEDQLQYLLQVIADHRLHFKNPNRSTIQADKF